MKWPGRRAEDCEEGFTWVGLDLWEEAWDGNWAKVGVEMTAGKEGNKISQRPVSPDTGRMKFKVLSIKSTFGLGQR